ncbi:MAG: TonB-dependent receptor [Novosphingobium sp.]|nr:TonB-dependent receptor [Novosphingobium sp.]
MRFLTLTPLLLLSSPALAEVAVQPVDQEAPDETVSDATDEILVVATRIRGQVDAPQPPVMTLDEADVASYGAGSLAELVEAISPQTGSGRGRGEGHPVMLVNGQRISSFRELRSIPPEAIRKLEVLPEEVALRFGYPPNQRVINFILKDNFSTVTVAGEYNIPTRGGFTNTELEAGLVRIDGPRRLNLEAKVVNDSLLTEAERGVLQAPGTIPTVAGDPDPAAYRSLVDDSPWAQLEGTWSTGLGEDGGEGSLSINGTVQRNTARALWGLDTVTLVDPSGQSELRGFGDPLTRVSKSTTVQGGVTLNKPLGGWLLTATVDGSHNDTKTRVDRLVDTSGLVAAALAGTLAIDGPLPEIGPAGFDRTRTKDLALNSLVTFSGSPFRLPAGEASLTIRGGFDYSRSVNSDTTSAISTSTLKRGDASGGFNISLPITSRKEGVLGGIGDVTANFSAGMNHLSDFGTLTDWSAGLTWNVTDKLGLQASYIVNEAAPSLNQLGNPTLRVLNVPVYDYTNGEAVLVTIINGGNPDLKKEKQRDLKLSANWELPFIKQSNLIVEYFRNRSNDVTQSFPLLTPAIEAAFPGRAVRENGTLVSIDRSPVTYDEISSSRIRWGFNVSGRIKDDDAEARGERRGGGRGPGAMMGGRHGGRWNISLYHTYRISEKVRIAAQGPVLDLLHGDALATGGVARNSLELESGVFHKGMGIRLRGGWTAPVTIDGANGASDLRFGSVLDLDARIFINLGQQQDLVAKHPFLKGMRIALDVQNIFDSRQKVTDANGLVPLAYQPDYRDARGRMVGIDIRKMF